jgi:hypothetical protein
VAALFASLSFPYCLQQDYTLAVYGFGCLQAVEQLVKTAMTLRQHLLSHLMNFFHDRVVSHTSSSPGDQIIQWHRPVCMPTIEQCHALEGT